MEHKTGHEAGPSQPGNRMDPIVKGATDLSLVDGIGPNPVKIQVLVLLRFGLWFPIPSTQPPAKTEP